MRAADPGAALDLVRRRELLRRHAQVLEEIALLNALHPEEFGEPGERLLLRGLQHLHRVRMQTVDEIRGSREPVAPSIRPVPTWSRP